MCMKLCMCVADRTNVFINLTQEQEQEQEGKYQKKYLRHRPASVVFVEWRAR